MRASTEKALKEATARCEAAGLKVKPAGFKYHSERSWLGMAENDDLILVEVPTVFKEEAPEELHVFVYSTKGSRELVGGVSQNKDKPSPKMSRNDEKKIARK